MPISLEKSISLVENKTNVNEVVLMSLIQAVNELLPGSAALTIEYVDVQAVAARSRGDLLANMLLTSAAERIGVACDLPGFDADPSEP